MHKRFIYLGLALMAVPIFCFLGIACENKEKAELEALESVIQIEAYDFEIAIRDIATFVNTREIGLPHSQSIYHEGEWALLIDYSGSTIEIELIAPYRERHVVEVTGLGYRYYWAATRSSRINSGAYSLDFCNFTEVVSQIYESNPYIEKTALEQHTSLPLTQLIDEISRGIAAEYRFLDLISGEYANLLQEVNTEKDICSSCPNNIPDFSSIGADLASLESKLKNIENWDYSNLNRYNELKAKLAE